MPARYEPQKDIQQVQVGDLIKLSEDLPLTGVHPVIGKRSDLLVCSSPVYGEFNVAATSIVVQHYPRRILESHNDFEVGDKVYLREESRYSGLSHANPTPDVQGEVIEVGGSTVQVKWPEGTNFYGDRYLGVRDNGLHLALVDDYPKDVPVATQPDQCRTLSIAGDMLFGSDLELFVRDTRCNKIIPAGCLIPGTKTNPFKLEHGVCHPDGLAVEVACPPSSTFSGLVQNLEKVLKEVKDNFFPEPHYVWDERCVVFKKDVLDVDVHKKQSPEWFISGCAPELNSEMIKFSWIRGHGSANTDVGSRTKERSKDVYCAGFHLHLGFTEWENTPSTRLDAATLVGRVANKKVRHNLINTERKKYYGGYGTFRMKPYGVEDRTYGADVYLKNKEHLEDLATEYKKQIMEALNASCV